MFISVEHCTQSLKPVIEDLIIDLLGIFAPRSDIASLKGLCSVKNRALQRGGVSLSVTWVSRARQFVWIGPMRHKNPSSRSSNSSLSSMLSYEPQVPIKIEVVTLIHIPAFRISRGVKFGQLDLPAFAILASVEM